MVGWKKRLHKMNRRKLYMYGRNVHNHLNFTVCEGTFRPNDPNKDVDEHVVMDNVALDGQVTLLKYKPKVHDDEDEPLVMENIMLDGQVTLIGYKSNGESYVSLFCVCRVRSLILESSQVVSNGWRLMETVVQFQ